MPQKIISCSAYGKHATFLRSSRACLVEGLVLIRLQVWGLRVWRTGAFLCKAGRDVVQYRGCFPGSLIANSSSPLSGHLNRDSECRTAPRQRNRLQEPGTQAETVGVFARSTKDVGRCTLATRFTGYSMHLTLERACRPVSKL